MALLALAFLLMPWQSMAADARQAVSSARLVEAARDELYARLPSGRDDVTLSSIGTPEDVRVGSGVVSLKVRPIAGKWPRPRVGVPVDILVDGRVARSTTVWFALSIRDQALTYSEELPIGTMASAIPSRLGEVDMTSLEEAPISAPAEIEGMRLRRPVRAGAPMLKSDFERIPDVDRHQKVRVLASYGAIHLATRGLANEMGNAGDVVPVLVDGADMPVQARVTDKGVVEVVQ